MVQKPSSLRNRINGLALVTVMVAIQPAYAQDHAHHEAADTSALHQGHGRMAMVDITNGWMALGMAQLFPTYTRTFDDDAFYVTQPALMFNIESPGSRITLRTTVNLEGATQPDGELTYGAWGEGFLDKRHPHTYLHELMLSYNLRTAENTGWSISAGKGFTPYGTDDPMMRTVLKYPTNHHLSQILERWTVNGIWAGKHWTVEAGLFSGNEPTAPDDLGNFEGFGRSFSARVTHRIGEGVMGAWPYEFSASYGHVVEDHDDDVSTTNLYNAAFRHEHDHGRVHMYALIEASMSDPEADDGYWSVLAEGSLQVGRHKPYGRIEYATRPEFTRLGPRGTKSFFRYDHDEHPIGATRWLILSGGYGHTLTRLPWAVRPYVETQYQHVAAERGSADPETLFGRKSFWMFSAGARVFLGGDPMRMGTYGLLDPMTLMHRAQMAGGGK